ncbi:MAG: flagellar hook-basal body complex protein [Pseudomonadota bacterium]|nr:flagellar hook-basal body complex protein [Pseudomonadota bacterium]
MIDALYISASGLRSEQRQIDVISNNVANMQTPGFKRGRVNFVEVATASLGANAQQAAEANRGNGTRILSTSTIFTPGELRQTRNTFDIAISGSGFFELEAADGSLVYTRDGQFRVDTEGNLATVQGLRLARGIQIPADATDVRVAANGDITALLAGDTERSPLGTLELATFAAPDMLVSMGENRFSANDSTGAASYGQPGDVGFGQVQQGYVEMSNVEMIDEMSALVMAQRAYQLNARVLQASDQILETINNLRR